MVIPAPSTLMTRITRLFSANPLPAVQLMKVFPVLPFSTAPLPTLVGGITVAVAVGVGVCVPVAVAVGDAFLVLQLAHGSHPGEMRAATAKLAIKATTA